MYVKERHRADVIPAHSKPGKSGGVLVLKLPKRLELAP
jgi:hypothetical protein